jgi:DNA-binding MarR family transcriptional regulator
MSDEPTRRSRPRRATRTSARETHPRQEPSALETHLGYWLRVVSNHVSRGFQTRVEAHGVTVAEWVVLRTLFDENSLGAGTKPSALAETLGLTRGAISKLVDRLVSKALVVVRADPTDGRAQRVRLSPTGRALVPELASEADENDAEAFGHLRASAPAALSQTLRGIVDRLGLVTAALE